MMHTPSTPEQHRTAVGFRVERRVQLEQRRKQRIGRFLVFGFRLRTPRAATSTMVFMPPSSVFRTTLPVKPSVTTTSTYRS